MPLSAHFVIICRRDSRDSRVVYRYLSIWPQGTATARDTVGFAQGYGLGFGGTVQASTLRLGPRASPPRPVLTFRVGVTGHRGLSLAQMARLEGQIAHLLRRIATEVGAIHADHGDIYAAATPKLSLLSQLAKGADQLVAGIGLGLGFGLRTVLPLSPRAYRTDFEGADAIAFDDLLRRSEHVWRPLTGRGPRDRAYALAGEATVAQSDIVLAIWDGKPARGVGGTGDVVEAAIRRGVPVLHVNASGDGGAVVLWSALAGLSPEKLDHRNAPSGPLNDDTLREIVRALLAPPLDEEEVAGLRTFLTDHARRLSVRPEYPLLLALTGVQPLRRRNFIAPDYLRGAEASWRNFYDQPLVGMEETRESLIGLQEAFAWADGLADHFAQSYRSAGVFNYVAGALAVMMALIGILAPHAATLLQAGELLAVLLLIGNTNLGNSRGWHRRWLDYRFLAEQLRPMRSLALLGAATPERYGHTRVEPATRWTDWYAAAIWRGIGPPPTIPNAKALKALIDHLTREEVDDQVAYNRRNAARMHRLDHRLHLIGTALFYVTTGLSVTALAAWSLHTKIPHLEARLMTFVSATLPTIAAAVFGIRGQGDFAAAGGRSAETAAWLDRVSIQLREHPGDLTLASRGLENATQLMLEDLGDWRVSYRHRKLVIPG